jgi:hypothetical protein
VVAFLPTKTDVNIAAEIAINYRIFFRMLANIGVLDSFVG